MGSVISLNSLVLDCITTASRYHTCRGLQNRIQEPFLLTSTANIFTSDVGFEAAGARRIDPRDLLALIDPSEPPSKVTSGAGIRGKHDGIEASLMCCLSMILALSP